MLLISPVKEVLKEEYKKDNKVLLGFRYYDFTFLKYLAIVSNLHFFFINAATVNLIFFISKLSNAILQIESLAVVHRINDFNITPPLKDTL